MLPQTASFGDFDFSDRTPDQTNAETDRRLDTRRTLTLGLGVSAPNKDAEVAVLDVSRTGMLIDASVPLETGEIIDITLPQAGTVKARVARYENGNFGMQFLNTISEATVSAVLLNAPAVQAPADLRPHERRGYKFDANAESHGLEPEVNFSVAFLLTGLLWLAIASAIYLVWY
ncbi:MAG: PilZ domain-containing protein [Pontixanthobacter sp.]